MAAPVRKPSAAQGKKYMKAMEGLVLSLFGTQASPLFDRRFVSHSLLAEFAQSDEAIELSFQYAKALMALWEKQYPGKQLKPYVKPRPKEPEVVPVNFPELVQDNSGTQMMTDNDPQTTPVSPTLVPHSPAAQAQPQNPQTLKPGQVPPSGSQSNKPADLAASFHLPNAKVGVPYAAKIEGKDSTGKTVAVLDVKISQEIGLSFNSETGELTGVPAMDGDHKIALRWSSDNSASYSGSCLLIVNPDPRSLWKVIEPPTDAPYSKPHTDKNLIQTSDYKIVAASRRGRSHEHSGSFRDDDFFIHHIDANGWNVIIVADGAGSAKYSRQGAKLAVETIGAHLVDNLCVEFGTKMSATLESWDVDPVANGNSMGGEFHYLFHKASSLAIQAIEQEAQTIGATAKEYSTTLLAAVVKRQGGETFLATFWMGDGAIAAYGPRGKVRLMGTPDGGEYAGQTRFLDRASLSDQGFAKRVGIGRYPEITAVMLMTDGVSDPRFETDNGLLDPSKWDALWDDISPVLASSEPDQGLVDWLHFFSQGHHDDRTIALLW